MQSNNTGEFNDRLNRVIMHGWAD